MDADKDNTPTCETKNLSDQEILLLATQPLNETNADTDAVEGENDDEEVDVVMTPPSNSEVLNPIYTGVFLQLKYRGCYFDTPNIDSCL